MSFFNELLWKKTLTVPKSYCATMLIGFYLQHLLKAVKRLFTNLPLTDFSKAMVPYRIFRQQYMSVLGACNMF